MSRKKIMAVRIFFNEVGGFFRIFQILLKLLKSDISKCFQIFLKHKNPCHLSKSQGNYNSLIHIYIISFNMHNFTQKVKFGFFLCNITLLKQID